MYWPNSKYQCTLPEKPQELQDIINAGVGKGVLTTTVSNIETHIRGMSVALEDTVSIHHDRLLFLEENLEVMIGVVQTLKGRVGSALNIGEKYVAPTF